MARPEKKKLPRFTSPRGVLRFPSLMKPDFGTKDYPKPDGVYKTGILFPQDDPSVVAFLAKLQPLHDEAVEEGRKEFAELKKETRVKLEQKNGEGGLSVQPIFSVQYDKETEEPTGMIQMNFSKKASGKRKDETRWTAKPPSIVDGLGNPITNRELKIWGGSVAKVFFEVKPYFIPGTGLTGLSFGLLGAQIIKLVSEGVMSAEDMGFEAEEDGFEYNADDFDTPEVAAPAGAPANADEADDF